MRIIEPEDLSAPVISARARNATVSWLAPRRLNGVLLFYSLTLGGTVVYSDRDTSTVLTGLTPATFYSLSLQACNIVGCTAANATFTTLEAAPEGILAPRASNVTAQSIELFWDIPVRENGNVTYSLVRTTQNESRTLFAASTVLTYLDLDVAPATSYNYSVVASTAGGSTASPTASFTALEASPTGVAAPAVLDLQARSVNVSIPFPEKPNGRIISTSLRASGPNNVTVTATGLTTALVEGLLPASGYQLVVDACTLVGCASSPPTRVTTKEACKLADLPCILIPLTCLLSAVGIVSSYSPRNSIRCSDGRLDSAKQSKRRVVTILRHPVGCAVHGDARTQPVCSRGTVQQLVCRHDLFGSLGSLQCDRVC